MKKGLVKIKERLKSKEYFFQFRGKIQDSDYTANILSGSEGNELLKSMLEKEKPFMVSRIGATQFDVINNYI